MNIENNLDVGSCEFWDECYNKSLDDSCGLGGLATCIYPTEAIVNSYCDKIKNVSICTKEDAKNNREDALRFKKEANDEDLMIFSFYPTKPVGSSDGGIIVSNDFEKIRWLSPSIVELYWSAASNFLTNLTPLFFGSLPSAATMTLTWNFISFIFSGSTHTI